MDDERPEKGCMASWRLNVGATRTGKYQFQVEMVRPPIFCLVGWCTPQTLPQDAVAFSLGTADGTLMYDTVTGVLWDGRCNTHPHSSSAEPRDKFDFCIDLDEKKVMVFRNGKEIVSVVSPALFSCSEPFIPCFNFLNGVIRFNALPTDLYEKCVPIGVGYENNMKLVRFARKEEYEEGSVPHTLNTILMLQRTYYSYVITKNEKFNFMLKGLRGFYFQADDPPEESLICEHFHCDFILPLYDLYSVAYFEEKESSWRQKVQEESRGGASPSVFDLSVRPVTRLQEKHETFMRAYHIWFNCSSVAEHDDYNPFADHLIELLHPIFEPYGIIIEDGGYLMIDPVLLTATFDNILKENQVTTGEYIPKAETMQKLLKFRTALRASSDFRLVFEFLVTYRYKTNSSVAAVIGLASCLFQCHDWFILVYSSCCSILRTFFQIILMWNFLSLVIFLKIKLVGN
eukprot:TRINITY_DN3293_c0_g1_i10.p1 TRINITY_DN3293_c0_g1~~TRINITY_DN3293_c0_g1_i10.p1  ORF type:complete len:528 (-),score=93.76 TRINITY_DN3293_c0_g1_i10:320-1693(-)